MHKRLNMNAEVSSIARGSNFGVSLHIPPYFMYAMWSKI